MRKIFWLLVFILIIQYNTAAFEQTGIGGRPGGMGNAYTGLAENNISIFYNPAGVAVDSNMEISMSHSLLYSGLDYDEITKSYIVFSRKLKISDEFNVTTAPGYQQLNSNLYKERIYMFNISGQCIANDNYKVYFGINTKILGREFVENKYTVNNPYFQKYGYDKNTFGMDLGLLYRTNNYSCGAAVLNINEPDMGLGVQDVLKREIRIGISGKLDFVEIRYVMDYVKGRYYSLHGGMEKKLFNDMFALRAGYETGDYELENITAGFGINFKGQVSIILDYSFQWGLNGVSDKTDGTHQLLLRIIN